MQSKARTVDQYLAELPMDRRMAITAVRKVILENLDSRYEEGMQYGMIGYYVPHHVFPEGYHCDPKQPLPFACLASQKNHMAIYLMTIYGPGSDEQWFREEWAKTGRKLDMGKSCIRFRKLEDLAMSVIGDAIRRNPADLYIARYKVLRDQALADSAARSAARKSGATVAKKKPKATAKKKAVPAVGKKKTVAATVAKKSVPAGKKAAKKAVGKAVGKAVARKIGTGKSLPRKAAKKKSVAGKSRPKK